MSFKVEVIADSSGKWTGNAIRLPDSKQAIEYGNDLFSRWTAVSEMRVVESEDPVNYLWLDGRLVSVERVE